MRPSGGISACAAAVAWLGCAGSLPALRPPEITLHGETEAGWRDLLRGKSDLARSAFERRLRAAPDDLVALAGRAAIDYERGDSAGALASYLGIMERTAAGEGGVWGVVVAPMAAGRLALLLDETARASDRAIEDRLLALSPHRLPWQARFELAQLGDRVARRRGQPELLERLARVAGCPAEVMLAGTTGGLPHLDLDAAPRGEATPTRGNRKRLMPAGCRVSIPSWDGRPGAQRLLIPVTVPGGTHQIVLDFPGEGRVRVDGGRLHHHGSEAHYGPRVSATSFALGGGKHEIEIRIGTFGGRSGLGVMVIPALPSSSPTPPGELGAEGTPVRAVVDFSEAFTAHRVGDVDRALLLGERLGKLGGFGPGLALAAAIARADPTRPSGFARDAARSLLRRAVSVDAGMARAWHALAGIELEDNRPRDAIDNARASLRAAPAWWLPELTLWTAYRVRGLERDADRALERAGHKAAQAKADPCPLVEAGLRRAEERRDLAAREALGDRLSRCDPDSDVRIERLRTRGDLAGALALLRRSAALSPDRDELRAEIASLLLAKGDKAAARAELEALVASEPRDPSLRIRLADLQAASGDREAARRTLTQAMLLKPELADLRRAAAALGLSLPLDRHRANARSVIQSFASSKRRYEAPAVVVLDRTVARVFPDGAQLILTHNIVRVQTKDGIDRWGEVSVPSGSEILTLRTHKADGSTREPEEIVGKETVSAADLAVGDYVEWETMEAKPPSDAFAGGFLGDRFYFRSFDAPLDRSELILISPAAMKLDIDRRAGAPSPARTVGADGTVTTSFIAKEVPQLFAERASVPAIEYVPSVRLSSGVSWAAWTRFLREQVYGTWRSSPEIRQLARELARQADRSAEGGQPPPFGAFAAGSARPPPMAAARRAATIVEWVTENIEAADDLRDPASFSLARGRGNRMALVLALARELGLSASPVLARSRLLADATETVPPQEIDDFGETLVRFSLGPDRPAARAPAVGGNAWGRSGSAAPSPSRGGLGTLPGSPLQSPWGRSGSAAPSPSRGGLGTLSGSPSGSQVVVHADLRLRHAPFGYLPPGLDGARTLSLEEGRFGVATSQAADQRNIEMTIRLDEQGGGSARATEELTGWPALEWAELLDRFGSDATKLRQDFEQRWLGVHFPGARLKDLDVELPRRGAAGVRVRYSFTSPQLAVKSEQEIKLSPTFFRSQPGRRFAAEPHRSTTLMLGLDVPVRLQATLELPRSARLVDPAAQKLGVIARKGGYRFVEERLVRADLPEVLVLRRESLLPLMRVTPEEYSGVAADLRRVDGLEQQEIRIRLRAPRTGTGTGTRP
jgi:tetratricopeptide (TPR) repeat protein